MKTLDIRVLIATLIAGLAAGLLDLFLYGALSDTMGKPMLIALLMVLFALIVAVVLTVVVSVCSSSSDELWFLGSRGALIAGTAVCLVLVFVLSFFLEWTYDHTEIKADTGNAYIFILDESGSMSTNDPNHARYAAVNTVMSSMPDDFPYMVYMFDEECVKIRDLAPRSAGEVVRPADADMTMMGLTYISGALTSVYHDIQNGVLGSDIVPHVILLTDGFANDMGFFQGKDILKDYANAGIRVSSVGLGNVDLDLMQDIADRTGGMFVQVNDASQLAQGFTNVTTTHAQRDLLSPRNLAEKDGLYMFLRILFLTLIGALIALVKGIACGDEDSFLWIMAVGTGCALVGALIVEFGLKLDLPGGLCRMLYWILLSITPHFCVEIIYTGGKGQGDIQHWSARGQQPQEVKSKFNPGGSRNTGNRGGVDWSKRR